MHSGKTPRSTLPGMTVDADAPNLLDTPNPPVSTLLVIDLLDEDTGLADVEDSQGRTYQLPAEWLPGAADGAAYRVNVAGHTITFTPDPGGAQVLRERSKQTLLDFSDEPVDGPSSGKQGDQP